MTKGIVGKKAEPEGLDQRHRGPGDVTERNKPECLPVQPRQFTHGWVCLPPMSFADLPVHKQEAAVGGQNERRCMLCNLLNIDVGTVGNRDTPGSCGSYSDVIGAHAVQRDDFASLEAVYDLLRDPPTARDDGVGVLGSFQKLLVCVRGDFHKLGIHAL